METIERDYSPKGVQFFYVYKSLAHPEYNNYVTPYTLKERLMHVREAEQVIGSRFRWICDDITNEFKYAMGTAPNAEFVIDPEGVIVRRRVWSDPVELRRDLTDLVGPVSTPTTVDELDLPEIKPAGKVARGIAPRVEMPGRMRPLIVEPLKDGKHPYYVKLRAEAEPAFLSGEADQGKLYLGFHLDPLYHVHWNNDAPPLQYSLKTAKQVRVNPATGKFPDLEEPADADPREFLLDIEADDERAPLELSVRYFACADDNSFCLPVKQRYRIQLERDKDGGSAMGRKSAEGQGMTEEQMLAALHHWDSDGDGKLTRDELPGPFKGYFAEWDADGDGFADADEQIAAARKLTESM